MEILNQKEDTKQYTVYFLYQMNTILFAIHLCLLVLFGILGIQILVLINIFSVNFYICQYYWIHKGENVRLLYCTIVEVLIHLIFAVVLIGWESGFQYYVFAILPSAFYTQYMIDRYSKSHRYPIVISIVCFITFITLKIWSLHYIPQYVLNQGLYSVLFMINVLISFAFLILVLKFFVNSTKYCENILKKWAMVDELTQMYNRRKIMDIMNQCFQKCSETADNQEPEQMAVAIVDIDDFKKVNDTYGHGAGDYVLVEISHLIRKCANSQVSYGRWGGEEFLIMANGPFANVTLQATLRKLIHIVQYHNFEYEDQNIHITLTAGEAVYTKDKNIDKLLSKADRILYEGKTNGKNQLVTEITA